MQSALLKPTASTQSAGFSAQRTQRPSRVVLVQARSQNSFPETAKRAAAAVGAVLFIASPFAGPALARPSDFIQSKPGASPGEPTNKDKFPYNPSTTGNQAKEDTGEQKNTNENPQQFSTLSGLGKAQTGSEANDPMPSPTETGPDPQAVGAR